MIIDRVISDVTESDYLLNGTDRCERSGHMAFCGGPLESVVDLRPRLDLLLTFRFLSGVRHEWTGATQFRDMLSAQIICEGSACGELERCNLTAHSLHELRE